MKRVVMFSGGVCSWMSARRVVERHGNEDVILLFADTLIEDEDLYRFLKEASEDVGVPVTRTADGRNPWDVFFDVRFMGNSRIDPCSRILKRELLRAWIEEHCDPEDTIVYLGYDWTELDRFRGAKPFWYPWTVRSPMCARPYMDKDEMIRILEEEHGIRQPRLNKLGFPHNNCGGFCVKSGIGNMVRLLENFPERYDWHARQEQKFQESIAPVTILKDRRMVARKAAAKRQRNKKTGEVREVIPTQVPLSLVELRRRVLEEKDITEEELLDMGGCGCFAPSEKDEYPNCPVSFEDDDDDDY